MDERFDLEGEIVWSTNNLPAGAVSPSGFGLRYTAINIDTARQIEDFVAERLT